MSEKISQIEMLCPKRFRHRIWAGVIVGHALLLISPFFFSMSQADPPKENIISVRMVQAQSIEAPGAKVGTQNTVTENQPARTPPRTTPKKPNKPTPPKKPRPTKTPQIVKPNPNKNPQKPKEEKTRWVRAKDIKISTEVTRIDAPKGPRPTPIRVPPTRIKYETIDLTGMVTEGAVVGDRNNATGRVATYDDQVNLYLRNYWDPPSKTMLSPNVLATYQIVIDARGYITRYQCLKRSTVPLFDATIEQLFKDVRKVPTASGVSYPYTITIEFTPDL